MNTKPTPQPTQPTDAQQTTPTTHHTASQPTPQPMTDHELAHTARSEVEELLRSGALGQTGGANLASHIYALEALERRLPPTQPPGPMPIILDAMRLLDEAAALTPGTLDGDRLAPFREALENLAVSAGR